MLTRSNAAPNNPAIILLFFIATVFTSENDVDNCNAPALGMESGAITDAQLRASSSFDAQSVGQQNARIRTERASGAWCPKQQIRDDSAEFIQVDLLQLHTVHAVETQGRYGNSTGREFVEFYFIDYVDDNVSGDDTNLTWTRYKSRSGNSLFHGNTDTVTAVKRLLEPPLVARLVRIVPYSLQTRTACLRIELYGCPYIVATTLSTLSTTNAIADDFKSDYFSTQITPFWSDKQLIIAAVAVLAMGSFACLIAAVYCSSRVNSTRYKSKKRTTNEYTLRADGTKCAQDAFFSGNICDATFFGSVGLSKSASIDNPNDARTSILTSHNNVRANLVTTLGAKGIPTHLLQRLQTFLPPTTTTVSSNDDCSATAFYATVQPYRPLNKKLPIVTTTALPTSGTLSSCCSISIADSATSVNSARRKNSSANGNTSEGGQTQQPPTLLDFNFPPPPPPTSETRRSHELHATNTILNSVGEANSYNDDEDENIYAEPASLEFTRLLDDKSVACPSLPPSLPNRVPAALRTSASTFAACRQQDDSTSFQSTRSRRKSILKPRTSATLDHIRVAADYNNSVQSLPKRLVKTSSPESGIVCDSRNCISQCSNNSLSNCEIVAPSIFTAVERPLTVASLSVKERIGGGKFTDIHLVSIAGQRMVRKSLKLDLIPSSISAARQALRAESQMMSMIKHHNFVQYYGECDDESILTEYVESGDLRNALQSGKLDLSEALFVNICTQISSAFVYLEDRQLVHGHFSTRSCLFTVVPSRSRNLPIFIRIASPRGANLHAQLRFSAPEAIIQNKWSNKTDIWSVGISVWEILHSAQLPPFDALTNAQLLENAKKIINHNDNAIFPNFGDLSPEVIAWENSSAICEFMATCWRMKPADRPDFKQFYAFYNNLDINS